jgi:excisionase family DNA binding protein
MTDDTATTTEPEAAALAGANDDYLTVPETAELAGVTVHTVWRWLREGKLRRYRTAGRFNTKVKRSELLALLEPVPVVPSEN